MPSAFETRLRRLEAIAPDPAGIGRVFRQIVGIGQDRADALARARRDGYGEREGDILILRTIVAL